MAKIGKAENNQVSIRPEDRNAVLAVISASQPLTIEELLCQLPWMRWGYLFSILVGCIHEGLLIVREKERCQCEVRTTSPRDKHLRNDLDRKCPIDLGDTKFAN